MENIIIPKPEKLEKLINIFANEGKDKLHILSDFDRTMTTAFINGEKIPSAISILRKENILNEEYSRITERLFAIYHPIEIDPRLPVDEKKEKMAEWWDLHNQELLRHNLNKKHLDLVAQSPKMKLRPGLAEFLNLLNAEQIPVVIMSASGLGDYVINKILENAKINLPNIHIISNSLIFDQAGNLTGFRKPYIHVLSKTETMLQDFPAYQQIKDRRNVLLLGDNIEDIGMIEGFDYDNLIKIGFLNENATENLESFKDNFDVVILNDGNFDYINDLIKKIT